MCSKKKKKKKPNVVRRCKRARIFSRQRFMHVSRVVLCVRAHAVWLQYIIKTRHWYWKGFRYCIITKYIIVRLYSLLSINLLEYIIINDVVLHFCARTSVYGYIILYYYYKYIIADRGNDRFYDENRKLQTQYYVVEAFVNNRYLNAPLTPWK